MYSSATIDTLRTFLIQARGSQNVGEEEFLTVHCRRECRPGALMRDSDMQDWGELWNQPTSNAGNLGTTLMHCFNKTLNTMQSIILKGHPHFLFTLASLNTFGSQNKVGSISPQDLYLGRSPSWNDFSILFGPT